MKTYVLDTNVLLHDPNALFVFQENNVVLPLAVIEEIDDLKRRPDEIGRNARMVSRELDELRQRGSLAHGVTMEKGGRLTIQANHDESDPDFPKVLHLDKADNRILNVAWNLKKEGADKVILVTKDLNLRVKADVLQIASEDFLNDKVDIDRLYTGVRELAVAAAEVEAFYKDGVLPAGRRRVRPNQFCILKAKDSPSASALGRFDGEAIRPLKNGDSECMGVRARNKEQRFALELLLDDAVKVVTLSGPAGTGKTLLALAAGLERVLEDKAYNKLLVTRPVVPMGQDLGFLPGEKEEKLRPWMQPLFDNLDYLFRDYPRTSPGKAGRPFGAEEYLMAQGMLEIEALTYIRGRSIPHQFIVCDEAQNLTPHMVKTLITRVGEESKIVFTGDPEQIDHPYLDESSNGLSHLVETLKDERISGHVTLVKGERSPVAELGAKLL